MSRSLELKQEGNRHFQNGDYIGAEGLYSKAIIADPQNPALYTNRAMARLKLGHWDSVMTDCQACLALAPSSMKANYYLSQALLSLGDHDASLARALQAHQLCAATNDKSLAAVTAMVLKCKKERWDHKEKMRLREEHDLEAQTLDMLRRESQEMLAAAEGDPSAQDAIREESERKVARMRAVFERARESALRRREVPEWVVDDIGFGVMVDPVVTKTGKSYERATIMEHLRRHPSDPLTREPLQANDLRPNLALRQACEEFLEENGWAVDW